MPEQSDLSQREMEIARAYAGGATYQVIAQTLCIAPSTVRTHLATIYRKLEVSSKLELATHLNGDAPQPRSQAEMASVVSELALSLEEAINRERALSEVLRIISASHGDLEAVMPLILTYALELCDAEFGVLFEYRQRGRFIANHALGIPIEFQKWFKDKAAFVPGPGTALGRMEKARTIVNIIDVASEAVSQTDDPLRRATVDLGGARSFVAIPMLAGDSLVGAFTIYRQTVRPFSQDTTRLAQMFAAQSVIALENARLIRAMQAANSSPG